MLVGAVATKWTRRCWRWTSRAPVWTAAVAGRRAEIAVCPRILLLDRGELVADLAARIEVGRRPTPELESVRRP